MQSTSGNQLQEKPVENPNAVAASAPAASQSMDVWSLGAAVLIPIIGVVLAIVDLARGKVGPGLALLLASLLGAGAYLALFGAA